MSVCIYLKYSIHHMYQDSNRRDLEPKTCNENYVN